MRSRRLLRAWYRLLAWIGMVPIVLGCAASPCSPRSAAALDTACAGVVVETWAESCPDAERVEDCPEAVIVLAMCDAAIARHAEGCR